MDETIRCPSCDEDFPVPAGYDGGRVLCPRCGRRFAADVPQSPRPVRDDTERTRAGRDDDIPRAPVLPEGGGLLPPGFLAQLASHACAAAALIGGLMLLLLSLERGRNFGGGGDRELVSVVLSIFITAAVAFSAFLNLIAASHYAISPTPARSRPLGVAVLALVLFQVNTVVHALNPGQFMDGMREHFFWLFGSIWILVVLELLRLSLLGWFLRAAEVPGRESGALPLALATPVILIAPWLFAFVVSLTARNSGPGEVLGFFLAFLVFASPLGVYVWSMAVLMRLRSQWQRAERSRR